MPSVVNAGYDIRDRLFHPPELQPAAEACRSLNEGGRAGFRGGLALPTLGARASRPQHRTQIQALRALAEDPRLLGYAAELLGDLCVPLQARFFHKSAETNWSVAWHQDTAVPVRERVDEPGWGPWSWKEGVLYGHAPAELLSAIVALRVHLDDCTPESGPLRVVPESHRHGRLTGQEVRAVAERSPGVECLCSAGGVVALYPLTIHASSRMRAPGERRVIHLEYIRLDALKPWMGPDRQLRRRRGGVGGLGAAARRTTVLLSLRGRVVHRKD